MHIFDDISCVESYIGLCSFNLKVNKYNKIYTNKYNPMLFKIDVTLPFKNSIYIIDQILCCR